MQNTKRDKSVYYQCLYKTLIDLPSIKKDDESLTIYLIAYANNDSFNHNFN